MTLSVVENISCRNPCRGWGLDCRSLVGHGEVRRARNTFVAWSAVERIS